MLQIYCTANCTCSTGPNESRTSSASWCTVACTVRCRSTWSTSAYQSPTSLLGSSRRLPVLPWHRLQKYGRQAFSVDGTLAWNSLPDNLRDLSVSRDSFRRLLKTHLFTLYWSTQRNRDCTRMRYTNLLLTYLLMGGLNSMSAFYFLTFKFWTLETRKHSNGKIKRSKRINAILKLQ